MSAEAIIPDDIVPQSINPLGNYAVQISWQDGFNQVASFELLDSLRAEGVLRKASAASAVVATLPGGLQAAAQLV
jgi:hypothetical protein